MTTRTLNCILCPLSCRIIIEFENGKIKNISGYKCPRGKNYAVQELTNPVRILTTTLRLKNGVQKLVPVKTDKPIPKDSLIKVMDFLAHIEVEPPIEFNQVLVENVLNTGANIIATTKIER